MADLKAMALEAQRVLRAYRECVYSLPLAERHVSDLLAFAAAVIGEPDRLSTLETVTPLGANDGESLARCIADQDHIASLEAENARLRTRQQELEEVLAVERRLSVSLADFTDRVGLRSKRRLRNAQRLGAEYRQLRQNIAEAVEFLDMMQVWADFVSRRRRLREMLTGYPEPPEEIHG